MSNTQRGYRRTGSGTISLSIRLTKNEMDIFNEILERRNANTEPEDRLTRSRVILTQTLNWLIDNAENDEPFPPHPSRILMKHDV
jgi:hypothetical protein